MSAAVAAGLTPIRRVLPNHVTAIVQPTEFAPAVTISASVRAGSVYEPADRVGLAYLVGHVLDRGTVARSATAIAETLDDRGVALHVSTNRHAQTLSCACLSEDFAEILTLASDVIRTPTFPEEEIEKRRAETITGIRQDQDNPAIRASEALQALLYGRTHPYGCPAKGTSESVERMRREDLVRLHAARYAPDTLTVVVVGDVDAEAALDAIGTAFGDWQTASAPDAAVPPVSASEGRREVRIAMPDKSQTDIAYGFITISRLDPAYYAYWMMNNILGQFGLGGRLAENIRERQGMAYYAFSAFDPSLAPGPLVIRAGVDPRNVDRALAAIDAEVKALGADGPTEREMAETRQYLIGSIPRLLETNQSIAAFLQSAEFFGLGLDHDRRLADRIAAVTIDEVRAAAADVLDPDRAAVAIAG